MPSARAAVPVLSCNSRFFPIPLPQTGAFEHRRQADIFKVYMSFASSRPVRRTRPRRYRARLYRPTPIQAQAIPVVLAGGDLLAGAQTGTGKTAGFTLPMLQRLTDQARQRRKAHDPRADPHAHARTRRAGGRKRAHLRQVSAAQIHDDVRRRQHQSRRSSTCTAAWISWWRHRDACSTTCSKRPWTCRTSKFWCWTKPTACWTWASSATSSKSSPLLPKQRQNLLFSATFSDEIKQLADGLLNNPVLIEVARRNATAELIEQTRVPGGPRDASANCSRTSSRSSNWYQVLVFTRTKHGANSLADQLNKDGIRALAIHGNKSQAARTRALAEFKAGKLQVLVATDIAARGIDINELPHVVNYELPNVPEDYVHRIGRTGRAGSNGEASSLVCVDEHKLLNDIERLIKRSLPAGSVAGFEPDPNARAQPILQRSGSRPQGAPRGNEPAQARSGRPGQAPTQVRQASEQPQTSGCPAAARPYR